MDATGAGSASADVNDPGILPADSIRPEDPIADLRELTGVDFAAHESDYRKFITAAQTEVQNTDFFVQLSDLHDALATEFVVGKIRAVDAWADGETAFRIVGKSWPSVVDKLYRINLKENVDRAAPPRVLSIIEQATKIRDPGNDRWVTPDRVHDFADDLLRTKFVVPFVDGVMDVSSRIAAAAKETGLSYYRRYHAKDSGYHAHHVYVLLQVPDLNDGTTCIALEIKVLTKLQDTLSELTHLLYELKRTGKIKSEKKRKLAWQLESPDFTASYVGHSAHYIESAMVQLKLKLGDLEEKD